MEWVTIANVGLKSIYFVLILATVIVVLLENRNPVKAIAWILALMFLPIVGLVFYFFFGQSTRRRRLISKKGYTRLLRKPLAEYEAQEEFNLQDRYQRLVTFFQETNQSFLFEGNAVEIFTDGYGKVHALIRELYKAKRYIHLEYYIIANDAVGRLIRDVLIDKAREGIEVRVIYDDVGCWRVPACFFEPMKQAGIQVHAFLEVRFPLLTSRVNYRNHHKIVIIDGQVGFIGGMNLAERYLKGTAFGIWRDTHLLVRGKAVHGLQTTFLLDMHATDHPPIPVAKRYFPHIANQGGALAQVVTGSPVGKWKDIMQGLTLAISSAKRYFYIQTPYFLPNDIILSALQTAALAGVDIRLMVPEHTDNRFTCWGTYSYVKDMLTAGAKVFFYQKGFLHSKLMVSDDAFGTVGSTNVDFRSFEHNFEANLFMYDKDVCEQLHHIFLRDQQDCRQIKLRTWQKRPLYQKVMESLMRLIAPLL
ncbi:MAG: cardiolipin synthase [Prevotellaceae bacterium]|jgi:cardiolipin synthase|nr:cardiolipin synthase [Prevotellaceae bacterium]